MEQHGHSLLESNVIYDPIRTAIGQSPEEKRNNTQIKYEDCKICFAKSRMLPNLPSVLTILSYLPKYNMPSLKIENSKLLVISMCPSPLPPSSVLHLLPLTIPKVTVSDSSKWQSMGLSNTSKIYNKLNVFSAAPTAKSTIPATFDRELLSLVPAYLSVKRDQIPRLKNEFIKM